MAWKQQMKIISCIIHLVILKYLSSEWVRVRERERDIWWEPLTELFCKKEGKFIAFSLSLASTIAFRTLCIEFGWCMENEKEKLVMDTMKPFDVRGKKSLKHPLCIFIQAELKAFNSYLKLTLSLITPITHSFELFLAHSASIS